MTQDPLHLTPDLRVGRVVTQPPAWLTPVLWAIAFAALLVPLVVVLTVPKGHTPYSVARRVPPRVIPPAELPPVEPLQYEQVAPDDARAYNATVPFSTAPNPAARPFRLPGGTEDLARATDCLAAAVWYEAGDDPVGERAVAQVVLNRVRHPAFPKTVCGVVFQGSERTTGCQFTFACDGSLVRLPSAVAWTRARQLAAAALGGAVDKDVGYATHYHTDWVVPYWQSSLDKITEVHTQLFYRWSGWWGTPRAFDRPVAPGEPAIAKLAAISDVHRAAAALAGDVDPATGLFPMGPPPEPIAAQGGDFLVTLNGKSAPDGFLTIAQAACGQRAYCKFMGWTGHAPTTLPLGTAQVSAMAFSYLRDRANGYEKALWNCARFKRGDQTQCMKTQAFVPADEPPIPNPLAKAVLPGVSELSGVHRKPAGAPDTIPQPTPTPTPDPPVRQP